MKLSDKICFLYLDTHCKGYKKRINYIEFGTFNSNINDNIIIENDIPVYPIYYYKTFQTLIRHNKKPYIFVGFGGEVKDLLIKECIFVKADFIDLQKVFASIGYTIHSLEMVKQKYFNIQTKYIDILITLFLFLQKKYRISVKEMVEQTGFITPRLIMPYGVHQGKEVKTLINWYGDSFLNDIQMKKDINFFNAVNLTYKYLCQLPTAYRGGACTKNKP